MTQSASTASYAAKTLMSLLTATKKCVSNAIRLVIRPETATREMSLNVGNATMLAIERTDASKNGIHPMRIN